MEMFKIEPDKAIDSIKQIAEFIATESETLEREQKTLNKRKDSLQTLKEDLAQSMMQKGLDKVKLDNGLTPSVKRKKKYYKQKGVSNQQLYQWLRDNHLGDIITDYVHFGTLQSALKDWERDGNSIPDEIINSSPQTTITM